MAEFTAGPPASIANPSMPPRPTASIIHGSRLEFAIEDGKVVMMMSDSSRLVMTPAATLGIATLLVRSALKAAPSTFGDERTTLSRMLREAAALAAPIAKEVR